MDGVIGKLTWGVIKKPQLEDRTAHFNVNESILHLSGLSKVQYAEIGYNPTRDEFELVRMEYFILLFISSIYILYSKTISQLSYFIGKRF